LATQITHVTYVNYVNYVDFVGIMVQHPPCSPGPVCPMFTGYVIDVFDDSRDLFGGELQAATGDDHGGLCTEREKKGPATALFRPDQFIELKAAGESWDPALPGTGVSVRALRNALPKPYIERAACSA
jgi:hypothetical protein